MSPNDAKDLRFVELRPGEVVLDLGSGGGIDVLLSARRVAPAGTAYGLTRRGGPRGRPGRADVRLPIPDPFVHAERT